MPCQRPSLSDEEYQELIGLRVRNAVRLEIISAVRFWGVIGATLLVGVLGLAATWLSIYVSPIIQQYEETPFVESLTTPFAEAERLTIAGRAFGPSAGAEGRVELFYRSDRVDTRTAVLRGQQIQRWTDSEITVATTSTQRTEFLTDVGASTFDNLTPYIRVVTADGRRSNLW